MKKLSLRSGLMATTIIGTAFLSALVAMPALAQETTSDTKAADETQPAEVVITGSILRKKNATSISPLTVVTGADLEKRGTTTVAAAIQNLSGNNSGALPGSFTANGAFAGGASGASLRGLLTSSTLVLIDGMRGSYYPLADDGQRNFVDLNSIPSSVIDRIEVLQDGSSATYGADAIAGVINIITKKQFTGLTVKAEYGLSEKGDAGAPFVAATWGKGDLGSDGWNVYVSGEYQKDDMLYNRERGFPYNTSDLSSLCGVDGFGDKTCGTNGVVSGIQFNGAFDGITTYQPAAVIREYNAANTTAIGKWTPLGACPSFSTPHTVTAGELAAGHVTTVAAGTTLCQTDVVKNWGIIAPEDTRMSLTGHFTKRFGDDGEAYFQMNYYKNQTHYVGSPSNIRANAPPAAGVSRYIGTTIALPVYVCAARVACDSTNGVLNPNNPYAAAGHQARILATTWDIPKSNDTDSQTLRIAGGVKGSFGEGWNYDVDFTGMQVNLDVTSKGYIYIQHLLDVVADGTYNFVDPTKNTQAVRDYVSPTSVQKAKSQLAMITGSVSKDLMALAGGPLQLGLSASARYEMVDDPSANPFSKGSKEGYYTINPFFSKGQRTVTAAAFELDAPILSNVDVILSGRYDNYSTGQNAFSPKIAAKWKATDKLLFRGTYSKGFRIPSIAEGMQSQTTGYIPYVVTDAAFIAAHGGSTTYGTYNLGVTTVGNPNLKPETSDSTNVGFVFSPNSNFSFSMDYFRITKDKVIAGDSPTAALKAYYAGTTIPAGFEIIAGTPDVNYPDALPVAAFVLTPFANLNSLVTSGFDYSATARFPIGNSITWTSVATATYVSKFDQSFPDGHIEHYAGTVGPYVYTAGSGTPQWRANWQNTFNYGKASLTATAYYSDGYKLQAEDQGDVTGECVDSDGYSVSAINGTYYDGTPIGCSVKPFVSLDLHGSYDLNSTYTIYLDVQNALGADAPLDAASYGGYNYQPVWANSGIIGRYFKLGVKATF